MNQIIVGVFGDFFEAQQVVQELVKLGIQRRNISIVLNAKDSSTAVMDPELKRLSLPGGVELMAQGAFGSALAESDEALANLGITESMARVYKDAVRSGGKVLVAVQTTADRLPAIEEVINRYRLADLTVASKPRIESAVVVPVVEEELQVSKREVQHGGVHVYSYVTERPVQESVRLREEQVTVERRPVDRPVAPGEPGLFQEGTFEVRQRAEEAVVAKEARIVEEVVVSKNVAEHTETIRDTLRRNEVIVEDLTDKLAESQAFDAVSDVPKIEGTPAPDWKHEHLGTWDRVKGAVRHAWERVRSS